MANLKSAVSRLYRSKLGRKVFFLLPRKAAETSLNLGLPRVAKLLTRVALRHAPGDATANYLMARSLEALGQFKPAQEFRARRLRNLLGPLIKKDNLKGVLIIMAELERTHRGAPYGAGDMIARRLGSEKGRNELLKKALAAQKRINESAFLVHLITLCMARNGDYRAANDLLKAEIGKLRAGLASAPDQALQRKRMQILERAWRLVDQIARENMDWADEPGAGAMLSSALPRPEKEAAPAGSNAAVVAATDRPADTQAPVEFKEYALQSRLYATYLELCEREFEAASSLNAKLNAVNEMMRVGLRRMPEYHKAYALARKRFDQLTPEIEACFSDAAFATEKAATNTVLELCTTLDLARRFSLDSLVERILRTLDEASQQPDIISAFWPAPAAIVAKKTDQDLGDRIMARLDGVAPKINRDVQFFFRWAELTRRHARAHMMFDSLRPELRRRAAVLYYVNILQRDGRVGDAVSHVRKIHAQSLCNPSSVNAFTTDSLINRTDELKFLQETARIYSSVPQPKEPKGVLLIGPRNIDQLRRYPLMVLLEFKRRGWAVVPIVQGFLPREETGIPGIDVMNGAVSPNVRLSPDAEAMMRPVEDFQFDPENAVMKWGKIDLGHSLWEDAAINRRRYNIDWTCPALKSYLSGLADWSMAMARVLQYARDQHEASGLPTGCVSLFSYRLPDSLFRFYCETYGDPETFFYLHTANGYQNYFTNFSTNISQRMVLRNMTRHPNVRSASFPLPENFETYYQERQNELPAIMERFAPITKVKRSTEGSTGRPPEADAVDARIRAWRAKGGRVACAFGKVVCDSGVPFDGGPAHQNMKDWINHCIRSIKGSDTMLLIKPHPHELNNQIATFPTEYFIDLIEEPLGDQVIFLSHRWFDMHDMESRMDFGLIYNGTTAVELGIMGIPSILAGHFAPIDYPVGHAVPRDRDHFAAMLRGDAPLTVAPDLRARSAVWLDYMANEDFTQSYRYHARPVTNKALYPPYWFGEDLKAIRNQTDPAVQTLIGRALGTSFEPGEPAR